MVTINSVHFERVLDYAEGQTLVSCLFNDTESPAVRVTDTSVQCTAPGAAQEFTNHTITVKVNGVDAVGSLQIMYIDPVNFNETTITPTSGPVSGGTFVVLRGTFYTPPDINDVVVRFGGEIGQVLSLNTTTLTCRSPKHSTATVGVFVALNGQDFDQVANFAFFADPFITHTVPPIGPSSASTSPM